MDILNQLLDNNILIGGLLGWIIAQSIKVLTSFIKTRKFDFDRVMGSGGMPSSHSATVMAVAIGIGQNYGYDSGLFAIAIVISFVVMYDASGVRMAAGKQAKILNSIVEALRLHKEIDYPHKLKELLGHTRLEVLAGAILGTVLGILLSL